MKILKNGIEIPDEDLFIWEAYRFRCVAHPSRFAVCLHEEPPKSKSKYWAERPERRFPVCLDCHEFLHSISRAAATNFLDSNRNRWFPKAERTILGHE